MLASSQLGGENMVLQFCNESTRPQISYFSGDQLWTRHAGEKIYELSLSKCWVLEDFLFN